MTTSTLITREFILSKFEDDTLAEFFANLIKEDGKYKTACDLDDFIYTFISDRGDLLDWNEMDIWYIDADERHPSGWSGSDIKDSIRGEVEELLLEEKPDPVVEAVKARPAFQTAVDLFKSCDYFSILLNDKVLGLDGYATGCLVDALAQHNLDDVALTPFQLQKLGEKVVDEAHRQWRSKS